MQPRKWLWPFFLAVFVAIQKTASALDVDIQDPGKQAFHPDPTNPN